ncbi:hypothetical protein L150_03919, partial [Candida albicans Ca529L]
MIYLKSLLNV